MEEKNIRKVRLTGFNITLIKIETKIQKSREINVRPEFFFK